MIRKALKNLEEVLPEEVVLKDSGAILIKKTEEEKAIVRMERRLDLLEEGVSKCLDLLTKIEFYVSKQEKDSPK